MNKKRQIVAIVSIVLLTLLIGTLFNMGFIVSGGKGGKKYEELWEAISELQNKVNSIVEKLNQTKTIRFYEPNETMNNQQTYKDGAIFVWTPNNSTDNAILQIHIYFQYRCESQGLQFRIVVNGETNPSGVGWLVSSTYKWSSVYTFIDTLPRDTGFNGILVEPNQNNYTIKFQFATQDYRFPAYVKNINIILTVADGLPAYNS